MRLRLTQRFLLLTSCLALGCPSDDSPSGGDTAGDSGADTAADTAAGTADETADGATAGDALDEDAILAAASAFATEMDRLSDEARPSQHALAETVHFYAAAEHRDLYLSIDPDAPTEVTFPEGTLLVKENLDADGASDGYFAMYKAFAGYDEAGGDWYWLRVNGAGEVGNSGAVGFCIDCHNAGAGVSDLVFGIPLDNRL